MTESNESRNMWRINRHGAGTKHRIRKLAHGPLKRLRFFQQTGQCVNSLGLCSYNWLKLRLGGRKICVVYRIRVWIKGGANNERADY